MMYPTRGGSGLGQMRGVISSQGVYGGLHPLGGQYNILDRTERDAKIPDGRARRKPR